MSRAACGVLVFFTSGVVLLLEILAGRLLAPYLGVTLETYSGIIGVVLAGLALGTFYGGRLADRTEPLKNIGPLLLLGGAFTLSGIPVIRFLGALGLGHGPLAILLFASFGFFPSAAVLSAISPQVVKLSLTQLDQTGRTVGRLSALGTAGALAGTFFTGFLLVGTLPSRPIVLVTGGALVAAGVVFLVRFRSEGGFPLMPATLAVCGFGFTAFLPGPCDVESPYFCAAVKTERSGAKTLLLDGVKHASLFPDDPALLEMPYARGVAAALATLPPGKLSTLFIGGGGFHLPRYVQSVRPGSQAQVLELDPTLVTIAQQKLGLPTPVPFALEHGDARVLLKSRPRGHYDFVLGDAFGSQAVPWHLTTVEFLSELRAVLKPEGVYVANVIDAPPFSFARAEVKTLRTVFAHVAVMTEASSERATNLILVASDEELDAAALTDALRSFGSEYVVTSTRRGLDAFVGDAVELSDDYAPVDQLLTVD